MAVQTVFKRYELKYLMTQEQKQRILEAMEPHMTMDKFGRSTIRNIYYDTDDYILARRSIMKPDFKEKLRIRSYGKADETSQVFVELKRKTDHIVYKRRVAMAEKQAMQWTRGTLPADAKRAADGNGTQMTREIDYFLGYYKNLKPAVFLSYDREAYKMRKGDSTASGDFRVTFDENILARDYDLSLTSEVYGESVMEEGMVLMELKCPGSIPLWMTSILSEEKIYKTSFSKYGAAYKNMIFPGLAAANALKTGVVTAAEPSVSRTSRSGAKEKPRKARGWFRPVFHSTSAA